MGESLLRVEAGTWRVSHLNKRPRRFLSASGLLASPWSGHMTEPKVKSQEVHSAQREAKARPVAKPCSPGGWG